ncbi:MAG: SAM-dependent methyltransferase [Bacteroidetes bacterium CG02_land_8_20_14_3_00_31_25]|nr:MAG: SAM-dependent methyltransferase [Bacteroidetes bacterium CG02_land_8_20_14_3_00_31_25]PIY06596.1 MAG: SAM-dependent methyltransferase [Bacteroidetes bacterium CG_4_10_14_3_um_filter_31_20]
MKGKLYLIPTPLGEEFLPSDYNSQIKTLLPNLRFFIVEELKTARRFLKKIEPKININEITFYILNEHTQSTEYETFLKPIEAGNNIGLLSEAGCPAIADPGAQVVKIAHLKNINVIPLIGPSSIIMAVMASGLNGQNFAFLGYLPIKPIERKSKIQQIEKRSKTEKQTQIFIEAPYRNISMFNDIIANCNPETLLCIACNITQNNEFIKTKKIKYWKNNVPDINKKPTVFLILA